MVDRGFAVVDRGPAVVVCGFAVVDCGSAVVDCGPAVVVCGFAVVDCGSAVVDCGFAVVDCGPAVVVCGFAVVAAVGSLMIDCVVSSGPVAALSGGLPPSEDPHTATFTCPTISGGITDVGLFRMSGRENALLVRNRGVESFLEVATVD